MSTIGRALTGAALTLEYGDRSGFRRSREQCLNTVNRSRSCSNQSYAIHDLHPHQRWGERCVCPAYVKLSTSYKSLRRGLHEQHRRVSLARPRGVLHQLHFSAHKPRAMPIKRSARLGPRGDGAAKRIRTPDPRITNALLYQLSYCGNGLSETRNHRGSRV